MDNLVDALRTKNTQIQSLRLSGMNHVRQLLRNTAAISDHKRLVVAIGEGSVARVDRVIHAALKKKRGVLGIRERSLGKLLWRLGGDRVGHIAHRALGLPSVSTRGNSSPEYARGVGWGAGYLEGAYGCSSRHSHVRRAGVREANSMEPTQR